MREVDDRYWKYTREEKDTCLHHPSFEQGQLQNALVIRSLWTSTSNLNLYTVYQYKDINTNENISNEGEEGQEGEGEERKKAWRDE